MNLLKNHKMNVPALTIILLFCFDLQTNAQIDSVANLPQFLYPKFASGIVKMKTGARITAVMNYNTVTEKMTYYQNGVLMDLSKPENVDTIFLQNSKFIFHVKEFYEVLVNAPVSLFIQHKSNLTSPGKPSAYGASSETAGSTPISKLYSDKAYNLQLPENFKVTPAPVYWVRINNVMHSFSSIRQFMKNFPGREDEIKQFINQSDINIKNQDDLIKLVVFYNGLFS